jgi:peroxiredoxin (alkyl hydroperoxide reductase subunit C)
MVHSGKATNTIKSVFIVDPEVAMRLILFYPQEVGRNMVCEDWWFCHRTL